MAEVKPGPRRGDVYGVAADPDGRSGARPAVVVSNDSCNAYGSRVVVVPLSTNVDSRYPGEAHVTVRGRSTRALGDQIRSIDRGRLRSRVGRLTQDELREVDEALRITLGLLPY